MMKFFGFEIKINEDVFFSRFVKEVAPREACEKFACEGEFRLGTFGYHAIEEWLTPEECRQIRAQYEAGNNSSQA
jgi:hypothetical protein